MTQEHLQSIHDGWRIDLMICRRLFFFPSNWSIPPSDPSLSGRPLCLATTLSAVLKCFSGQSYDHKWLCNRTSGRPSPLSPRPASSFDLVPRCWARAPLGAPVGHSRSLRRTRCLFVIIAVRIACQGYHTSPPGCVIRGISSPGERPNSASSSKQGSHSGMARLDNIFSLGHLLQPLPWGGCPVSTRWPLFS